jgi:hypothetical protein
MNKSSDICNIMVKALWSTQIPFIVIFQNVTDVMSKILPSGLLMTYALHHVVENVHCKFYILLDCKLSLQRTELHPCSLQKIQIFIYCFHDTVLLHKYTTLYKFYKENYTCLDKHHWLLINIIKEKLFYLAEKYSYINNNSSSNIWWKCNIKSIRVFHTIR